MLKWLGRMECADLMERLEKTGQSVQWKGEKDKASTGPIELSSKNGPFNIQ
jgi:hypothetical protein